MSLPPTLDSEQFRRLIAVGDLPLDTPTPVARILAKEEINALQTAVAQLPDNYREAIRLRYEEGLNFTEIGAALGCSAEAARKLWARAITRLEQQLGQADSS